MCYTFAPTEAAEYLDDEDVLTPEPGVLVGYKWLHQQHDGRLLAPHTIGCPPEFFHEPNVCVADPTPHGFHVHADPNHGDFVGLRRPFQPIVRVLVPRAAVRPDGHVTHLMIIPPGEHETREDIEAVAAVNRELVRTRAGADAREKVNAHNPQCGETVKTEDVQRQTLTTA